MSQFELAAILLVLTATFSWVNFRLAVLPHTIGLQEQQFDHPAHQIALQEMVEAVRVSKERVERLEKVIEEFDRRVKRRKLSAKCRQCLVHHQSD